MSALAAYLQRLPLAGAKAEAVGIGAGAGSNLTFVAQLRALRLGRRAVVFLAIYVLGTAIMLASWACIGNGALSAGSMRMARRLGAGPAHFDSAARLVPVDRAHHGVEIRRRAA
ncbi:MAG: hypothetical protein WDO12_09755 [Pseudomonadota bacterium]